MKNHKYQLPTPTFLMLGLLAGKNAVAAPNLSAAEYFIDPSPWLSTATSGHTCDNDPGLGQGTPLVANDGAWDSVIETVQLTNISSSALDLALGTHAACVRFKDNNGSWGSIRTTYFTTGLIDSFTRTLIACEYYIDTDPGIGAGQPLSATDGLFDENTETVTKTAIPTKNPTTGLDLTAGTHTIGVRCQDNIFGSERWGMVKTGSLIINPIINPIVDPIATTSAATNVTATSATLNGSVTSKGATATASFDFGTTTSYGASVTANPAQIYSSTAVTITGNKTGLNCNTTYHYRAKAISSVGTGYGLDKTFTTPATCGPNYTVTSRANPINGGTINPNSVQAQNATALFTVTANNGYTKNTAVTGTCPQGNWSGDENDVWTTGPIIANCNVVFNFTPIPANSWLAPPYKNVLRDRSFTLDITAKSDTMKISAYEFIVTFDANKLNLDQNVILDQLVCNKGVCQGKDGLSTNQVTINTSNIAANTIKITGLANAGEETGPGNDLQLLIVNFKSRTTLGLTPVNLTTIKLENASGDSIGTNSRNADINVTTGICGDADGNATVNIVDALAISRKLVGLPPPPTIETVWADVDKNGVVSIVDALHIARYSVGLVLVPGLCAIGQPLPIN